MDFHNIRGPEMSKHMLTKFMIFLKPMICS